MKLIDRIDSLLALVEANFKNFKYLTPMFISDSDGELSIKVIQNKDELAEKIELAIGKNQLREFIIISEAWVASVDEVQKIYSVKDLPNKKEVVFVQYCSLQKEILYTAEINRAIIDLPSLEKWEIVEKQSTLDFVSYKARFQDLFLKAKSKLN